MIKILLLLFCLTIETKSQNVPNFNEILLANILTGNLGNEILLNPELLNLYFPSFSFDDFAEIDDPECVKSLQNLWEAIGNGDKWGLEMFDASAKPQSGILMGNIMHVGSYDECLKIHVKPLRIKGQYCTALMKAHSKYGQGVVQFLDNSSATTRVDNIQMLMDAVRSYGFCVPSACSAQSMDKVFDILEKTVQSPIDFKFREDFCDTDEVEALSTGAIIAIFIFAFFALLLVASTLYDIFVYQQLKEPEDSALIAFSVYTNLMKLLSTSAKENQFGCLNGIRVISMMWIVLAHGYMYTFYTPKINAIAIKDWQDKMINVFIPTAEMAVDTFFTVSGLLVSYLFFKYHKKGIEFNIAKYYIHRIVRLTPSLAMIILFTAVLATHMGNGPFWPVVHDNFAVYCQEHWWATLLYVQNIFHKNSQCMGQGWYLAVDTQMYFISPFILFALLKWPKQTLGMIGFYIILESAYVFAISVIKDFNNGVSLNSSDRFNYIYIPTYVRGTVYLIGMIAGFYISKSENKKLKLPKFTVLNLWLVALGILLTNCLISYPVYSCEEDCVYKQAAYNSLSRISWAFAISLISILCIKNHGGVINSFLSCKLFTILIRLNYNIYLLHMIVMIFKLAQERIPTYFRNLNNYHSFWGDYMFTLGAALIWTLSFEYPVIALEGIMFKKNRVPKTEHNNENGTEFAGVEVDPSLDGNKFKSK